MKNSKRIIGVATLMASLSLVAMPAMAASANLHSCVKTADQLRQALNQNQNSPNYVNAKKMQRRGLEFCNAGMYKQGMSRYGVALRLLGADTTAAAAHGSNS